MRNLASTVLSVLIAFVLLCIIPIFYVSIIQYARSTVIVLSETRNLIDNVIDTRKLSEDDLADFQIGITSTNAYYNATIMRKVRVVNPDPNNPGKTYTTFVVVDDIYNYNQGDRIIVKVEPIGQSLYQVLARAFLQILVEDESFTLAGRVR